MTDDKAEGTESSDARAGIEHDEPLAGNVERLLRRASAGPKILPEAKERIHAPLTFELGWRLSGSEPRVVEGGEETTTATRRNSDVKREV